MAEVAHCVRARRSRPAGGNFHLLAQMKVTKAKGLEHDLAAASGYKFRLLKARVNRSVGSSNTRSVARRPGETGGLSAGEQRS